MSDDHKNDDDYDVGYGKPPKATQFKRGQSGNPKGRPKGAKGFTASLKREMDALVTIRIGGRDVRVSKAEAAAMRLIEKALKGDMAALRMLASVDAALSEEVASQAEAKATPHELDQDDDDILRHFAGLARAGDWDPEQGSDV